MIPAETRFGFNGWLVQLVPSLPQRFTCGGAGKCAT